ncbi:hypothetical protein IWX90DRAFT_257738 [Phyllosticta citrichinensis]|uniref:tyrosine--tRNA ligase n=1 Tax=Phyllosticta citrichinensis TaxID=1130410 RepID=A0ABR1XS59_9PEZI
MLPTEEKFNLITRQQAFLSDADRDSLRTLLARREAEGQAPLKLAWETTPTGKPHVGYFVPLAKLIDFLRAGLDVTVYYLDVYGFLVNYVHSMETVAHRQRYYDFLVRAILVALGVPPAHVNFVAESSIAYQKNFVVDTQRLCALMTQKDARDTSDEVAETKMLSPMLCAVHQSLSEVYLDLDVQYGGVDQTGLFEHAKHFIPALGYRQREHLMNTMVAGLDGLKMSSSKLAATKIEFLDAPHVVRAKIDAAACPAAQVEHNGVLGLVRDVLLPISVQRVERLAGQTGLYTAEGKEVNSNQRPFCAKDAPSGTAWTVFGEEAPKHFYSYGELEEAFVKGEVSPEDLKEATIEAFNRLLAPIRSIYAQSKEWQEVDRLAYPDGN